MIGPIVIGAIILAWIVLCIYLYHDAPPSLSQDEMRRKSQQVRGLMETDSPPLHGVQKNPTTGEWEKY